jgi:hypothetical protein
VTDRTCEEGHLSSIGDVRERPYLLNSRKPGLVSVKNVRRQPDETLVEGAVLNALKRLEVRLNMVKYQGAKRDV